jgi:hypothetical protein
MRLVSILIFHPAFALYRDENYARLHSPILINYVDNLANPN